MGIVTSRDHFVFDFDRETLKRRIRTFLDPSLPDDLVRETFGLKDSNAWKLAVARQALRDNAKWEKNIVPCLYRPFDVRWLFYHPAVIERGREEVMRHMLAGENVALITARSNKSPSMDHFFCSTHIVETKCGESTVQSYTFPLYLYPHADRGGMFAHHELSERRPNLNPALVEVLEEARGCEPTPEESFHYVYAVLYAPTYREKYAEFLRIDFPRIPFTTDPELFQRMAELGKRLVDLHLLRSAELDSPIARFQGEGDGKVVVSGKKGLRYDAERQRVYINQSQYFEGVPPEVWEYQIGGYQVCQKWLKDRKDRKLTLDDIRTYCRIATALSRTIETQREVDALYSSVEENPLVGTAKPKG